MDTKSALARLGVPEDCLTDVQRDQLDEEGYFTVEMPSRKNSAGA